MYCKLLSHTHLSHISSASGVEFFEEKLYIMGDDIATLFVCDVKGNPLEKIQLFDTEHLNRIPKKQKPDFEAMAIVEKEGELYLALAGSGSKNIYRDKLLLVKLQGQNKHKVLRRSLVNFYDMLRDLPEIKELNIEGLVEINGLHIFFQRGGVFQDNYVIISDLFEDVASFNLFDLATPSIEGIKTGISGAAYHAETDSLWLCASAEDTSNAIDDGEIKGSCIAVMYDFHAKKANEHFVIDEYWIPSFLKGQKIESLALKKVVENQRFQFFAVADNDNGTSELFELEIEISGEK
ncbi:MAG: DUF6929 family protein [Bacteroidia bacterium]